MISVCVPTIRPEGLKIVQKCLSEQTFTDFEVLVELGYGKHDLNASYNRMLKRAKGDIFVSWQDFIKVKPDFLERIHKLSIDNPRTFFTCPVGKTNNLDYSDEKEVKWDYRKPSETILWNEWEIDLGFCPMSALKEIGGFDEELDKRWSFDNVSVGYRAERFGYQFGIAKGCEGIAYDHDAFIEHPFRKDYDPKFFNERMEVYKFNPKLEYL